MKKNLDKPQITNTENNSGNQQSHKKDTTKILLWVLTGFMLLSALVFFPSVASILMLVFCAFSIPVSQVQDLWKKLGLNKILRTALLCVLFVASFLTAPTDSRNLNADPNTTGQQITEQQNGTLPDQSEVVSDNVPQSNEPSENTPPQEINEPGDTDPDKAYSTNTSTEPPINPQEEVASLFDATIADYSGKPYIEINGNNPYFTEEDYTTSAFEYYSDLDSLGRCGVAYANVCEEIMPTEERGEIGSVKPSGWQTIRYNGVVDGNYLYNRCHLIGYQLAGENANEENLITGTRYLNVEGMLPFENMVADYVQETGNHVLYRVTPDFEGDNLVASGVFMEAYSVEDNGDGVSFCVYCYNVQPGISIDYKTGNSSLIEETGSKDDVKEPIAEEQFKPDPEPQVSTIRGYSSDTTVYVSNSGKVHLKSNCSGMKNYTEMTLGEADSRGYEYCQKCW